MCWQSSPTNFTGKWWHLNVIELMPVESERFCRVMGYMLSGWSEVFPSSDAEAQAVVR